MKVKVSTLNSDLRHERAINEDMRKELHRVESLLGSIGGELCGRQQTIDSLHCQISQSRHAQSGISKSLNGKEDDTRTFARMINDKNDQLQHLEGDICCKIDEINKLNCKLSSESESTSLLSRDKDSYAYRNSSLSSMICTLRSGLEEREKELC